ncbi:hypothetical protein ScPMuIL_011362 [Solemya velum]
MVYRCMLRFTGNRMAIQSGFTSSHKTDINCAVTYKFGAVRVRFGSGEWDTYLVLSQSELVSLQRDSLAHVSNMMFTTRDRDNDRFHPANCAHSHEGGWWYDACSRSSLNGEYYHRGTHTVVHGVYWYHWKTYNYSLKLHRTFQPYFCIRTLITETMNSVIYIVSVSLLACCICQEIIDKSYFSTGDRQSCCKDEHWERKMAADIQALKESNSNLQEQLRNSTADIQALKEQLGISTSDIQTLNQSNLDLQEQLRQAPLGHATDCGDFKGTRSGVYKIKPQGVEEPFPVYCDIQTEGEGWTVFQRRQDGSVDFYQDWASYETGFGDLMGEFWLGNSFIHDITQQGSYELMVNMSDFEGNSAYAHYNYFNVGNASTEYTLTVYDYNGNAGDSLAYHNNMKFTTHDRDNDVWDDNCAVYRKGGWWYKWCSLSNLNGEYHHNYKGLFWRDWKGLTYSLKSTTMSVRRRP